MISSRLRTSDGLALIDQWRASGLSQKAFCESKGIGYARFHYWYAIYRSETPRQPGFIPIAVAPSPDMVILRGENGIALHVPVSAASASFMKQLLSV